MIEMTLPMAAQKWQKIKKIVESKPVEGWHYYVHQSEWDYLVLLYGEDWVNTRCVLIQPLPYWDQNKEENK